MKKNIIFYLNNDKFFTFPIAFYLLKKIKSNYNVYIKLGNTSFKKKVKIILILLLDGSIKNLFKFNKTKISLKKILSLKNTSLLTDNNKNNFNFGISINYPSKILKKNYKIYNFHFGNFKNQRGTFIFFYRFLYKWKNIDLTFHEISEKFDCGKILNKISINIHKMNTLELIAIPLKYKSFYWNSFKKINAKSQKFKSTIGLLNMEPSFNKILSFKFLNEKNN